MTSTHHDGVNLDSNIPRILHYTAPTKTLRRDELRLTKRTHTLLPDWVIRLWDDNDNSRLVQKTIPALADNYEKIAHGVARSDIARCLFLYRYGGLYLDTDYRFIRAIDEHLLKADCILPQNRSGLEGFQIENAIMASKPN
jgi:mannosyltransferase OCH1-like enzyme